MFPGNIDVAYQEPCQEVLHEIRECKRGNDPCEAYLNEWKGDNQTHHDEAPRCFRHREIEICQQWGDEIELDFDFQCPEHRIKRVDLLENKCVNETQGGGQTGNQECEGIFFQNDAEHKYQDCRNPVWWRYPQEPPAVIGPEI